MEGTHGAPSPEYKPNELTADELALAQRTWGEDVPIEELTRLHFERYDEIRIRKFGSLEAAREHAAKIREYEAEWLHELAELDKRVRGK